jgi:hypothetical protein
LTGLTGYTGFFHFPACPVIVNGDENGKVTSTCGEKIHGEYFV